MKEIAKKGLKSVEEIRTYIKKHGEYINKFKSEFEAYKKKHTCMECSWKCF